jgi:hypothetical protein
MSLSLFLVTGITGLTARVACKYGELIFDRAEIMMVPPGT